VKSVVFTGLARGRVKVLKPLQALQQNENPRFYAGFWVLLATLKKIKIVKRVAKN
jgi:hypothetical protein